MHVVIRTGWDPGEPTGAHTNGERETTLRVRSSGATVGDLLDRLAIDAPGMDVDGRFAPADLSLTEAGVVEGAVLAPAHPHPAPMAAAGTTPARALTVVAGHGTGTHLALPEEGTVVVGRGGLADLALGSETVSERHAEVTVTPSGHVRVRDLGSSNGTWIDGEVAHHPRELTLGGHVRMGAVLLRLDGPMPDDRPAAGTRPVNGVIPFNRPPREAFPPPVGSVSAPGEPQDAAEPPPFSLAALVAPLVMGGAMALLYNPRFALFAALSPIMAVGNWVTARRRAARAGERSTGEHDAAVERLRSDLERLVREERERRRARLPDVGEVARRATGPSRRLWERGLRHDDALRLRVGVGAVPWEPPVTSPSEGPSAAAAEAVTAASVLPEAPVEADLREGGVIGIVGDRDAALALARALLVQASVHHGPADVHVAVCTDGRAAEAWDWTKWLPHVRDPGGTGRWLAPDRPTAEAMLSSTLDAADQRRRDRSPSPDAVPGRPVQLLVVDAPELLEGRGAPVRRVLAGEAGPVAGIVIAETEDRLPTSTTVVVDLASDLGDAEVRYPSAGLRLPEVLTNGLDIATSRRVARALARYEDPELATGAADLPDVVRLLPLLELEEVTPARIADGWAATGPDPAPAAPVGVDDAGVFVVDLAGDGPHGLIGGTTGSGKSELLRSLVAGLAARLSPEQLVFVLVDYKGGSAFDLCAELPHTVGLVTDLDAHLGERALVSLEAELTHREHVLRDAGAQDLPEYRRLGSPAGPLPRLAVVIDEFATMATELPDFLGALVGVAQRGRSLGVHLLLATQRPSGAVNANIKANTNLRIALRVQDVGDSGDIIDRPDAAHLSRSTPGRAYVRRGAGDVTLVQTALSTAAAGGRGPAVEVLDFPFAPSDPPAPPLAGDEGAPSDLARLVEACRDAFAASGRPAPRRPWLPMIAPEVALSEVRDAAERTGAADDAGLVPYGLADDPAAQAHRPVGWRPAAGHLSVSGMVGSGTTTTLRTLARSLVHRHGPDRLHLYALDFGGGGLAELSELPHTGAVVAASDVEAQHRLVRHLRGGVARRRDLTAAERSREPLTVLLVDDLAAFLAEHDGIESQELVDGVRRVLAEGPGVGVVVAYSQPRPTAVSSRVTGAVAQQLLLQQADPADFAAIGMRARDLPSFVPGRGIASDPQLVVQVAQPGPLDAAAVGPGAGPGPTPIAALPASVAAESLPEPTADAEVLRLPIGLADADLGPAVLVLHPTDHLTVAGPPRSGKTSTLCLLADQLRRADPEVVLVGVCDRTRSSLYAYPALDACGSLEELAEILAVAEGNDRRWVFLVDDATGIEDVGGAMERLVKGSRPGLHVVVAGRTADLRGSYGHWSRAVRQSRTGLLLQPDLTTDGDLLAVRLPRRLPLSFPPGRGFLVSAGELEVAQVARPHREPPRGSL